MQWCVTQVVPDVDILHVPDELYCCVPVLVLDGQMEGRVTIDVSLVRVAVVGQE